MALDNTSMFTKEELLSFDLNQLHRICGYLGIDYGKKDKKAVVIRKIWEVIKPLPMQDGNAMIDGVEVPVTARIKRIQESLEK